MGDPELTWLFDAFAWDPADCSFTTQYTLTPSPQYTTNPPDVEAILVNLPDRKVTVFTEDNLVGIDVDSLTSPVTFALQIDLVAFG